MDEDWVCAICLDGNPDDCHTLVPCNHRFHTACLIEALRRNGPSCPYCRGLPNDHPPPGQNNENIQLVINEIADEVNNDDNLANDDPVPGQVEVENNIINPQQQINDIINNNQHIFNMLENQINDQILRVNELILIRGNLIVNTVMNRELDNQLRQEIRNIVLNNINIMIDNNNRLLLVEFIRNSNLNDDEKNFVLNIINVVIDNFNMDINQEDAELMEAFVNNDNNVINADNVINIFMNHLYQNIEDEQILQQLLNLINNNMNIINNNHFRDNIINAIRNRNNVNINDRNNLINHINNIYNNVQVQQ